jgi:uncharacterized membrane protein YkoI
LVHGARHIEAAMWAQFGVISALGFALVTAEPAVAAERRCLTKEQARAAVASGKAVRISVALKAVKRGSEVVGVHLCEGGKGLVYRLTVLARDGKVTRVTVDATSGSVLTGG